MSYRILRSFDSRMILSSAVSTPRMDHGRVSQESVPFSRPYRSHRVPACERCRRRKGRCVLDVPGGPCRHCRERNMTCNYQSRSITSPKTTSNEIPAKRPRLDEDLEFSKPLQTDKPGSPPTREGLNAAELIPAESAIIMDPHMSEDIVLLEHYLSGNDVRLSATTRSYNTVSTVSDEPVVYLTVPRKRKGLPLAGDPGKTQKEIIQQVLYPFAAAVRELYFDRLHPCFPILDEKTFRDMWLRDKDGISSTLVCDLYASAVIFWKQSDILRYHPEPDINFLWNTAVTALQEDFLAPTISTVHSALLDMVGRPVGAVTGNIVNAGRVVTLAQSLGLHRDPTKWKITMHEKHVRIRLWWGVLIHDHWSSFGHGIPPTIDAEYSDVPLPDLDVITESLHDASHKKAASTFYYLCKLTQILGDILPYMYALRPNLDNMWRILRKAECSLDDWDVGLPDHIRHHDLAFLASVNGSANLRFAYLSAKVLICRLAFKATVKDPGTLPEARRYRLAALREASYSAVDFIVSLQDQQLQQFWLPYTSHLLVIITTVLLRCTIECDDVATKKSCVRKVVGLRDRLLQSQDESGWDLAIFCLERCHGPIQRLADAFSMSNANAQTQTPGSTSPPATTAGEEKNIDIMWPLSENYIGDQFLQIDLLDYPWENLWDLQEEPSDSRT